MTCHRIAQIAENRNPKSPENRSQEGRFLRYRLLHPPRFPARVNGLTVLHGRLYGVDDALIEEIASAAIPAEDQEEHDPDEPDGDDEPELGWSNRHAAAARSCNILIFLPRR